MTKKLLEVKDLKVSFFQENKKIQVVRGFDLSLGKGEIVGILGESGSGKTVSATSIIRLEDEIACIDSGTINFKDQKLLDLSEGDYQKIRGKKIAYIFQNASSALNPYRRIGIQLLEVLKNHKMTFSKELVLDVLKDVGLEEVEMIYDMYPFQLSGGQNQRIMIAQSIITKPDLLIADEPTSSVDASLRKVILDLLKTINKKFNMSIIFITHDFDVAKYICDRLLIMYGGLVLEESSVEEIFNKPLHPYTSELMRCSNSLLGGDDKIYTLDGFPPVPQSFKDECPFVSRCKRSMPVCYESIPQRTVFENRHVRCFLYEGRQVYG